MSGRYPSPAIIFQERPKIIPDSLMQPAFRQIFRSMSSDAESSITSQKIMSVSIVGACALKVNW